MNHPEEGSGSYRIITDFFDVHKDEVTHIEILQYSEPSETEWGILIDGPCIGIPKKVFVSSFLYAVREFTGGRTDVRNPVSRMIAIPWQGAIK